MSNERNIHSASRPRRGMGPGRGMVPGEKAKNLKGALGKILRYMGKYKIAVVFVMIIAACSTVFSVLGPKVLGKATTGLAEGLMAKVAGTGGIDFSYIGKVLLFVLCLYLLSSVLSFVQGWIMTGITQKICYRMRKEITEKINRMPMKYFESRTYGEVLSRITNDVDTLGMGLNQSVTQIITSTATIIAGDDAQYFSADDTDRAGGTAGFGIVCFSGGEKIPEAFYYTAGVPRTYQWTGRRKLWWSSGH